ncbi:MAG: FeoA family protein [Acidobacteriota bacterium]|nr:FeoA family protein [Acidobacteriota bacterium]
MEMSSAATAQDAPQDSTKASAAAQALPLTQLAEGQSARLLDARLASEDCLLLSALGLTDHCRLRLCKCGDPWIVQVRTTRIGLAEAVARKLLVLPEPHTGPSPH